MTNDELHLAVERFVEMAHHGSEGMHHQVAADLAGGIGKPVGKTRGLRIEKQARRPDPVAGENDHLRLLLM